MSETNQEDNIMSPKPKLDKDDKASKSTSSTIPADIVEEDLNEIDSVDSNLDSINSVLDFIEQRTDNIKAQLLELLTSSREIRQSIHEENEQKIKNEQQNNQENNGSGKDGMDMS